MIGLLVKSTAAQIVAVLAALGLGVSCQDQNSTPEQHNPGQPESSADDRTGTDDGMMGQRGMGEMMGDMPGWMMSGDMMMDGDMMQDMHVIHGLLMNHETIRREVENIPGGVRTITTSSDPEVARLIRSHVYQMKERIEEGRAIRHMDPLFREIFEHHEKIEMQIEEVPGGVRVTETSDDPQITSLIRQHARRAVSEFVEGGMPRAMQPTPLPEGYPAQKLNGT